MSRYSLACSALAVVLVAARAPAGETPRIIRVTGQGKATAPPAMATVDTGVVTESATAEEALTANSKAMSKVMAAAKGCQIAAKDIQTSRFNVRPVYKQDSDGRRLTEIASYQVTNQVRVWVRELAELGKVLDALVRAGSNQVSGVSLSVGDPASVLDKARVRAVADARRRADLYAKEAGVRVGKVLTISEQPVSLPQPRNLSRAAFAKDAAGSVPIATGEDEFSASVHVVFALEDAP